MIKWLLREELAELECVQKQDGEEKLIHSKYGDKIIKAYIMICNDEVNILIDFMA